MFTSHYDDYTHAMERLVDSEYQIVQVPVRPMNGARYGQCYDNVRRKILRSGGRIQYGWLIMSSPWFVLGIHHAVWENALGHMVDVTPIQPAMDDCLFIPDDRIVDDGSNIIDNIRYNIHQNPVVDDSFDFALVSRFDSAAALHAYENHPLHQKKVNEVLKPLSKKIVVYDVTR